MVAQLALSASSSPMRLQRRAEEAQRVSWRRRKSVRRAMRGDVVGFGIDPSEGRSRHARSSRRRAVRDGRSSMYAVNCS